MQFTKRLQPLVQNGTVTCSVRIWKRPRVKVGGRYAVPPGEIEVLSITGLTREDLTPELAVRSGFDSVEDLLKTAQHGSGECIFLIDFRYRDPVI